MQIELRSNAKAIANHVGLDAKEFRTAAVAALNKTATSTRTASVNQIMATYAVRLRRDVLKSFRTKKATFFAAGADVIAAGKRLPLYAFKVTPKQPLSSYKRKRSIPGVTVEIRRGRQTVIPGSFVARMPSGHLGVFTRKDRKGGGRYTGKGMHRGPKPDRADLPIREMTGDDVAGMFGAQSVQKVVGPEAMRQFSIEMDRAAKMILARR